jgi:hypothetical protein
MNGPEDYEQNDTAASPSTSMQPLAVFEIRAPFLRLSVFLWNLFMTIFAIFILTISIDKISVGGSSIWIVFFLLCGTMLPRCMRACCSSFAGSIAVYRDRIVQRNIFLPKTVRFSDAFSMVDSPKYAGGPVLYFTGKCPNSFLRRLGTILLLNNVMIIHIWMLSDAEVQRLASTLSELSGRPNSAFSTIGSFQPFYPHGIREQ